AMRRILQGQGSISSIAYEQDIICPEETTPIRPAVFLPDQLERVTELITEGSKDKEISAATTTLFTHAPTIAYHFKNATLFDGSIYVKNWRHPIAEKNLFATRGSEARLI